MCDNQNGTRQQGRHWALTYSGLGPDATLFYEHWKSQGIEKLKEHLNVSWYLPPEKQIEALVWGLEKHNKGSEKSHFHVYVRLGGTGLDLKGKARERFDLSFSSDGTLSKGRARTVGKAHKHILRWIKYCTKDGTYLHDTSLHDTIRQASKLNQAEKIWETAKEIGWKQGHIPALSYLEQQDHETFMKRGGELKRIVMPLHETYIAQHLGPTAVFDKHDLIYEHPVIWTISRMLLGWDQNLIRIPSIAVLGDKNTGKSSAMQVILQPWINRGEVYFASGIADLENFIPFKHRIIVFDDPRFSLHGITGMDIGMAKALCTTLMTTKIRRLYGHTLKPENTIVIILENPDHFPDFMGGDRCTGLTIPKSGGERTCLPMDETMKKRLKVFRVNEPLLKPEAISRIKKNVGAYLDPTDDIDTSRPGLHKSIWDSDLWGENARKIPGMNDLMMERYTEERDQFNAKATIFSPSEWEEWWRVTSNASAGRKPNNSDNESDSDDYPTGTFKKE